MKRSIQLSFDLVFVEVTTVNTRYDGSTIRLFVFIIKLDAQALCYILGLILIGERNVDGYSRNVRGSLYIFLLV